MKNIIQNQSIKDPDYIYNIEASGNDSFSITKRCKNFLISYNSTVITYFIRKITNLNN